MRTTVFRLICIMEYPADEDVIISNFKFSVAIFLYSILHVEDLFNYFIFQITSVYYHTNILGPTVNGASLLHSSQKFY
jgi:hypothetical protein